ALFESDADVLGLCGCIFDGFGGGVDLIGDDIFGGFGFTAADGDAPHAFIDRITLGRSIYLKAEFLKVFSLLQAAPAEVSNGSNDVKFGRDGTDDDIEADLVIACAGGAMDDGRSIIVLGNFDHVLGLDDPFYTDGE